MALRFEDPPPKSAPASNPKVYLHADALRARQGAWAIVATYPKARRPAAGSTAGAIRSGDIKAFLPRGSFEAMVRTVGEEVRIYARYVGEQEASDGDA